MALLNENNLQARIEKAKKHRVNHVGTKLNQGELHAFEALCEKREQTPSELIRMLVLREIETNETGSIPSPELVEILSIRLFLVNVLRPLITTGEPLPEKTWESFLDRIAIDKHTLAESTLQKHLAKRSSKRA